MPELYVGANSILSGEQFYKDLKFQHYWKSMSHVPEIAERGYQMFQHKVDEKVCGISIDKDITGIDHKQGKPQWLIANY